MIFYQWLVTSFRGNKTFEINYLEAFVPGICNRDGV